MNKTQTEPASSICQSSDTKALCPACRGRGLKFFYSVRNIPVHSCLLYDSPEKALDCGQGNLELALCENCGFITNAAFDPQTQRFADNYEDAQGFSATFNVYANELVADLIDRYGIRQKHVLEIGCGAGQFLTILCNLGNNRGTGIDPASLPHRLVPHDSSRIKFIPDYYTEKFAALNPDIICCRHTLEHISDCGSFVKIIRGNIDGRGRTPVFFEVPDVSRILQEGAFWDIYYEHCSYFTSGSLARLFRQNGFQIDDLQCRYDGQYLTMTAIPATDKSQLPIASDNDLQMIKQAVENFTLTCSRRIEMWKQKTSQLISQNKKIVIWQSGSKAVAFLSTLGISQYVDYVVDINPQKHGKFMSGTGQQIVAPDFLKNYRPDVVIAMNPVYKEEIAKQLKTLGLDTSLLTL